MPASSWTLWSRLSMIGGLCREAGSCTTATGSQYVSIRYTERLAEAGVEPSVGSVGDSDGNALAETINGLYKAEGHRHVWTTPADQGLFSVLYESRVRSCLRPSARE